MVLFKKKRPLEYIIYSAVILVGIIIDQISKFLVYKNMEIEDSIPLIKGFLHITNITNDGASFGMMDGENQHWIFIRCQKVFPDGWMLLFFRQSWKLRKYLILTI